MLIQLKKSTYANAVTKNPILAISEPCFIIDKSLLYVGDGVSRFTDLVPVNIQTINVRVDNSTSEPYVESDGINYTIVFPKKSEITYSGGGISSNKVIELIKEYSSDVDLSNYTLLTTTQSISGNLQSQINQIVQEGTSIASSGGSILVSQNGVSFNLEVANAPIQNHNELNGLEGIGGDGGYWHLSENQYSNISGGVDLSDYTLLTTTSSISGSLNARVTNLETSTSGITGGLTQLDTRYTSNGNYVHLSGNETISGNKTFVNSINMSSGAISGGATITAPKGTGASNEGFGSGALESNTSGVNNTALGYQALQKNTSGNQNTAIGYQVLQKNASGFNNIGLGYLPLAKNTDGFDNIGIGYATLYNNTIGDKNTALGSLAGYTLTSGNSNTALGFQSLHLNSTGSGNVAIGKNAGYNETGSNKLYIDSTSLTTGTSATALIYGDFSTGKLFNLGNEVVTLIPLSGAPTPTTTKVKGNFGYYGGYLYRWIADSVVVRSAVETTW